MAAWWSAQSNRQQIGLFLSGELRGHFAGKPGRGPIDFRNLVRKIVLAQHHPGGSKGVGFDDIAADRQKTGVDLSNDIGTAQDQNFVAALLTPEIIRTEIAILDVGAHGAVINDHALANGLEKIRHVFLRR